MSTIPLKRIATIIAGQSPASGDVDPYDGGRPFLQGNAEFGAQVPEPRLQCSVASKVARPGDVLLSVRAPVGAVNVADQEYGIGRGLCAVRANGPAREYLWWYLQSQTPALRSVATGSTFEAVSAADVGSLQVPRLAPRHMAAIAGFLDRETAKIDALIDKQEQLIATLREDRAATIHNAVTTNHVDPSSQALQLKRISRILDCKHLTAEFTDDGIPLASIREVQGRYVNLDSAKRTTEHFFHLLTSGDRRPQQGDLIFSRNATVGQVAEVQNTHEPFAMGQDVCLIRPNRSLVRAGFLWYSLRSDSVLRQLELMMIGSTFKRINVEEVKNIIIDVPSLKEQDSARRFLDERVSKIDALIDKSTGMIETLREYRSALITNAVTGKIDVREAV